MLQGKLMCQGFAMIVMVRDADLSGALVDDFRRRDYEYRYEPWKDQFLVEERADAARIANTGQQAVEGTHAERGLLRRILRGSVTVHMGGKKT